MWKGDKNDNDNYRHLIQVLSREYFSIFIAQIHNIYCF